MYRQGNYNPPRYGLRILGWTTLLLGLPIALFAMAHEPNEYAIFDPNIVDCEGPGETYLLALPTFLIYGAGVVVNGLKWRSKLRLVVIFFCLAICILTAFNIARAIKEERRHAETCRLYFNQSA